MMDVVVVLFWFGFFVFFISAVIAALSYDGLSVAAQIICIASFLIMCYTICLGLAAANVKYYETFKNSCYAAGGNHVERMVREADQCWDTKTGKRIFFEVEN